MRPALWTACWIATVVFLWTTASSAEEFLPTADQKVKIARQVYDQLTRSISDPRTPPEFRVVKGKATTFDVALFLPSRHAIYLEEHFYDVLESMLPQERSHALALILSHELAHFYRNHRWAEGFSRAFAQRQQASRSDPSGHETRPRESAEERRRLEAEADYFSGFYSHLAGFQTLSIAPQVFDAIYLHYRFDPALPAYEHLRYRKETAREAQQRLGELLPLFDAGVQALLIRDYTSAGRIFDRVATEFPSPEVLNNTGVADALAALAWYSEAEERFAYPIELDPDSRLAGDRARGEALLNREEQAERRRSLLEGAKRNLDKAVSLNPSYVTAIINLACVLDLLGDYASARTKSAAAQSLSKGEGGSVSLAHAHTITGIVLFHQGEKQPAMHEFELAAKMGDPTAAQNLDRLVNGGRSEPVQAAENRMSNPPEQVAGVNILDIGEHDFLKLGETRTLGRWDAVDEAVPGLTIVTKQQGPVRTTALIRGSGSTRSTAFILSAQRGAGGQTGKGVQGGHTVAAVERAYGVPTTTFSSGRSSYHVYQSAYGEDQVGIVFQFDGNLILEEWVVFRVER